MKKAIKNDKEDYALLPIFLVNVPGHGNDCVSTLDSEYQDLEWLFTTRVRGADSEGRVTVGWISIVTCLE